ncbi:MAG: DNA mismatch repair endonuclease MutL [Planctomycetota bacterium]|jgi:DNA mismatch repair protein MutL|nr:DNA mismatch repair endonuclease MutL [Planctomycetota bacterium]MDP7251454.1 DNA mismatch repair endonuclease MutL [Planctomycetota bacterium]
MPKIQVLPPAIANRIAAGEVVERPSSVVKELVENSLDAGASRVEVEIEEGGKNLIRIADDGIGIEVEDLPLCFASHATSKLKRPEDLFSIGTLGFRGEALASIGSVAQAKIVSRYRGEDSGAEIECNGGKSGEVKARGASQGTQIEIRNLFFNVPVRRKFLKSNASETASITDTLTKMSLAYPGVHFKLSSNGKEVFNTPPSTRIERISTFFGRDLIESLLEVDNKTPELTIEGFVALPAVNRANRTWQHLFLNGRFIQDKSISHAMNEAYRGLMMERRFPIMFLFLEMDPAEVDVNAHPTKIEVRFRSEWSLYGRILNAIRQRLLADEKVAALKIDPQENLFGPQKTSDLPAPVQSEAEASLDKTMDLFPGGKQESGVGKAGSSAPQRSVREQSFSPTDRSQPEPFHSSPHSESHRSTDATTHTPPPRSAPPLNGPFNCMQIHDSYIVQETADGFIVIDQHALHERILFCEIRDKAEAGKVESQRLLLPEPVELTPKELAIVRELDPALKQLGMEVEEFGKNSVVIQAVPAFLKTANVGRILHDLLSELGEGSRPRSLEKIRERILATMACKAAVKFGDRLKQEEIVSLIERSAELPETIACPHGRPTKLAVNLNDLERQFGRT